MTTDERVSNLETHLEGLRAKQAELRGQLRQAHVDRWQGRIEDLELQAHLAATEGNDRVDRATTALRDTWARARAQLLDVSSDADSAARDVHDRVQEAYDGVRASLIEAKKALSGSR